MTDIVTGPLPITIVVLISLLTGIFAALISSFLGPMLLDVYHNRKANPAKETRKQLLTKLLSDKSYKRGIRSFHILQTVSGMKSDACRDLLIEIGARGVVTSSGNEAWKLTNPEDLKTAGNTEETDGTK